jgi:hypothetical protein
MALGVNALDGMTAIGQRLFVDVAHGRDQTPNGFSFIGLWPFNRRTEPNESFRPEIKDFRCLFHASLDSSFDKDRTKAADQSGDKKHIVRSHSATPEKEFMRLSMLLLSRSCCVGSCYAAQAAAGNARWRRAGNAG